MELWKQLEILRKQDRNWLFGKDNTDDKIEALNNIDKLGLPSAISYLIPLLKDKNIEIRNLTFFVILNLFDKISTKKSFYETLKYSDIKIHDFSFYKNNFPEKDYVVLLAIASLNSNGFIREKALKEMILLQNPFSIQFLIYRLSDWVENVREIAIYGIQEYKKPIYLKKLIENVETFEWLQSVQRVNLKSVYLDIINFIVQNNKDFVLENFRSFSDKSRFILAKELSKSEIINQETLQLFITDKHFIVRNITLQNFNILSEEQIKTLLKDKSSRIRFETLYNLKNKTNFKEIIIGYIADNSATIRGFARFSLKNENLNFPFIYKTNLEENKNILGSIAGIAETNGKEYTYLIENFLTNNSLRYQKFSFLALTKLDEIKAYDFAILNLDTKNIGLRNLITNYLSKKSNFKVLETARNIFKNGDYGLKVSMLKLFGKIGKYATIGDLMIGTTDENEKIRTLSVQLVKEWKQKANSYFTSPKPEELERAKQIFEFAFEYHNSKRIYSENPINEIDFYIK